MFYHPGDLVFFELYNGLADYGKNKMRSSISRIAFRPSSSYLFVAPRGAPNKTADPTACRGRVLCAVSRASGPPWLQFRLCEFGL